MRLANYQGRATVMISDERGVDVHTSSEGRFGPSLPALFARWDEFREWLARGRFAGRWTPD